MLRDFRDVSTGLQNRSFTVKKRSARRREALPVSVRHVASMCINFNTLKWDFKIIY